MKKFRLLFQGYTWDDYFYVIANKSGILIAYKGGLDSEGVIRMDEILFVDEADTIGSLYESEAILKIRKSLQYNDRLFFSYAEMSKDDRKDVTKLLKMKLEHIHHSGTSNQILNVSCSGACALFPKELLS